MTYAGARGKTANEMRSVLGFRPLRFNVHNSFRTTLTLLNSANGQYTLAVANRLFARDGFSIRRRFVNLVTRKYLAGLDELDFAGNPSGAAAFINHWVEQNTNNKIRNIVNANAVRNALLILANAIYFKGFWDKPFDPKYTRPGTFHVSSSQTKTVNMMHMTAKFAYSDNRYLNCKILALPYKGERLAMYVLLPKQKTGLASLERKINFNSVTSALADLQKQKIAVVFPKFEMTLKIVLKDILMAMGMKRAFNSMDFSGIAKGGVLSVEEVIHKAFIKVDEKGTEAAAATAVIMVTSMPTMFVADHPFLFLIRDNLTGSILFLGRLVNP